MSRPAAVLKIGGGRGGEQGEPPRARADGEARRDEAARPALRVASRMAELRLRRTMCESAQRESGRSCAWAFVAGPGSLCGLMCKGCASGLRLRPSPPGLVARITRCLGDGAMDARCRARLSGGGEERQERCAACGGSARPPQRARERERMRVKQRLKAHPKEEAHISQCHICNESNIIYTLTYQFLQHSTRTIC